MNPSSLKFPPSLKLWRTGRRTRKIILLLTLLCAGQLFNPIISMSPAQVVKPETRIESIGNLLGKGIYGEVFEVKLEGLDGSYAGKKAIKANDQPYLDNEFIINEKIFKDGVDHTGITRYFGKKSFQGKEYLIFEKMDGDVRKAIENNTFQFETRMVNDLLEGLQFLYSKGINYLDIKPANILYKKNTNGPLSVKFIDIGEGPTTRQYGPIAPKTLSEEQQSLSALGLSLLEMRAKQSGADLQENPELLLKGLMDCDTCIEIEIHRKYTLFQLKNWWETQKKIDSKELRAPTKEDYNLRNMIQNRRELAYRIMMDKARKRPDFDAYDEVVEKMIMGKYNTTAEAITDLEQLKNPNVRGTK